MHAVGAPRQRKSTLNGTTNRITDKSPRSNGKGYEALAQGGHYSSQRIGHKEASQAVQIDAVAFEALRRAHHTKGIIALRMPGSDRVQTALIRHIQRDPRSGKILHIDFYRVSLTERITVKIPLRLTSEAPAVKNEGGVLLHLLDTLEVECAAQDIVDSIEVDVSPLDEIDAILHAEDVRLPANYVLITDPKEGVAKVAATRAEVAEVAAEAAAPAEAPAAEAAGEVTEE